MAIAFRSPVATAYFEYPDSPGSYACSKPSNAVNGDCLVACITVSYTAAADIAPVPPVGWGVAAVAYDHSGSDRIAVMIATKYFVTGETSYTFTHAGTGQNGAAIGISAYSDMNKTPIDDSTYTETSTDSTLHSNAVTTTASSQWVIATWGCYYGASAQPAAAGSGYTERWEVVDGAGDWALSYMEDSNGTVSVGDHSPDATISMDTSVIAGVVVAMATVAGGATSVQQTKNSAWNIASTGVEVTQTKSAAWNVKAKLTSSATKSTAWSIAAKVQQTKAAAWDVRSTRTQTKNAAWNIAGAAAPPASAGLGYMLRLVAYEPNGDRLGLLPQPLDWSFQIALNDTPALKFSYSKLSPAYTYLATACEVAVEWTADGMNWDEPVGGRFLRINRSDDNSDPAQKVSFDCPGYEWVLSKANLFPNAAYDNADGKRAFAAAKPGAILKVLIDEAQARGALAGLTYDFTSGLDSAGEAWANTITIEYDPGIDLLSVLQGLAEQGVCDYIVDRRVLRLYNPTTVLGRDYSTGNYPVTLRYGRDLTEAPDTGTIEGLVSDILVLGDQKASTTLHNGSGLAPWGRWETMVTHGGVTDTGTMTVLGQMALDQGSDERVEMNRSFALVTSRYLPFRDYRVGDYIVAPDNVGVMSSLRVMAVTLTGGSSHILAGNATLNDRLTDRLLRDSKRILGIVNGSTQSGGSTAPPTQPAGVDTLAPAQVQDAAAGSVSYFDTDGNAKAQVTVSWTQVTTNTDASAADDVTVYEIWERQNLTGTTWRLRAAVDEPDVDVTLSPYDVGESWLFKVRAVDRAGNKGAFSADASVDTASDEVPPNQPSTPTVTAYLGQLVVTWDGKDTGGAAMPADFYRTNLYASTTAGFTPGTSNYKGSFLSPNGGTFLVSGFSYGTTVYIKFVSYDKSGNASSESVQASGTPARITNTDILDQTIDGSKIEPGSITSAMGVFAAAAIGTADIQNLAVDDAKIANVEVGKLITGELAANQRIIAGDENATHAEVRTDGFAVVRYNAEGTAYDAVRMGVPTGEFLAISDPNTPGSSLASISDAGDGSFQGLTVDGTSGGEANTGITLYGKDFSEWLDDHPRGLIASAYYSQDWTSPALPNSSGEVGIGEISWTQEAGRNYRLTFSGLTGSVTTSAVGVLVRLRYTNDGTSPTIGSSTVVDSQFSATTTVDRAFTIPPMIVSGLWGDPGDVIRVVVTVHTFYGTGNWYNRTYGSDATLYPKPIRMTVEDIGREITDTWIANQAGGAYSGSPPSPPAVKKTYVSTWYASWARTFRANGTYRTDTTDAVQGYGDSYNGDQRAFIGFPSVTTALSGATVTKCEVYLYMNHSWYNSGGTARIGTHSYTSAPGSMSGTTAILTTHFNNPQGAWLNMSPYLTLDYWRTGSIRGFSLGPGNSSNAIYYMRFNGVGGAGTAPCLRLTYVK